MTEAKGTTLGRAATFGLCLMMLAGCQTTEAPPPGPDIAQLQKQAVSAQRMGQHDTALKFYLEILDAEPENMAVIYQIGQIQAQLGHYDHAIKAFHDVLRALPDHREAMTALALVHMETGDVREAYTYLDKATEMDQERLIVADEALKVLVGDPESQDWHQLDADSPIQAYLALGILTDLDGDYEAAQRLYRLVLEQNPTHVRALNNLGYSYYLAGDLIRAEIFLRQATQRQPDFTRAWTNLGLVYVRMGNSERAFNAFKRVMPDADAYNDIGYFAMLEGRFTEAETLFLKAIDASPTYFAKAQDNLRKVQQLKGSAGVARIGAGRSDVREALIKARINQTGFARPHDESGQ
ncbi:tetratricopeptide repeat protein [Ferrimonas balearica]|uniref:tetratricopeptide repeat protein n=1 Tax=Ferrimonas balearica TaxID=44012 RepID=UPI001C9927C8|nr:tetratricopeptide repeat protein [Ferrimonas balearica]MBY5992028.1 tetratricopeptide repeat protein [Ferrimonas balearica]